MGEREAAYLNDRIPSIFAQAMVFSTVNSDDLRKSRFEQAEGFSFYRTKTFFSTRLNGQLHEGSRGIVWSLISLELLAAQDTSNFVFRDFAKLVGTLIRQPQLGIRAQISLPSVVSCVWSFSVSFTPRRSGTRPSRRSLRLDYTSTLKLALLSPTLHTQSRRASLRKLLKPFSFIMTICHLCSTKQQG